MYMKIRELEMIFVFLAICYITTISGHNLSPSSQPEAYFNGSAYLRVQTTISLKKVTGLSFRTCSGGTLFKQQQSDDYFELLVNSEAVLFSAKTAGKQFSVKIQGNFLNNKWHLVVLEYELGNLTLRVDNERRLIANGSYQNELLTSPSLYNEGASVLLVGKQYSGCLMEGPGLVFDKSNILSNHNVIFETCPIPDDSCIPKENLKDNNSCVVEPCMRRGTCHNTQNGYTCSCLPRYTGKNCEFDLGNPCDKIPPVCKNGATCNADSTGEYTCFCPPNFTGRQCEQEVIVHPQCHLNPCKNGGTCTYNNGDIQCLCMDGFVGARCESNIDECKPNPCKNGGGCHDGSNNFTCDCSRTGYTGRLCDVNINECLTNPCLNHGTCFDTYGTFLCQCPPGFGGSHCQNSLHECMSHPCLNHGVCVDNPDGFTCQCPPGFGGERCEEETRQMSACDGPNCHIDICLNNPCKNGGLCAQNNGYFNCSCQSGFVGKLCETKADNCLSQPCQNGGICIEQHYGITCNCTEQWMGQFCETPYDACAAIKPCKNNATCITLSNKYDFTCKCLPGYDGKHCENDINDCIGVICAPGKICVDLINDYECRCPLGYSGENCSLDSDPCAREPCLHGGICKIRNDKSGFSCQCPSNFTGDTCEMDVDECALHPKICNNGICQNLVGTFQCYCKPGFTGERCNLDFDECLSTPCKNGARCHNLINNYQCECPPGYTGKDCSIDINECEPMPCENGATCRDGINSFTCECPLGFDGETCHNNIDDCESSPCKNDAQCIDGLNAFTCNCTDTGYMGETCEINIDDCVDNPCQNGAECHDQVKDYECTCFPGYTGKNCELDINECDSSPCKYNGTCLERSNHSLYNPNSPLPEIFKRPFKYENAAGYECLCVEGVTGENCEIDINECESSPCIDGTCVDKIGGFYCECDEGFEGEFCDIDIDECERYKPCVHGRCLDKRASYDCECASNFGGKNCSVELTGCESDPCLNYGTCKPYLIDENIHRFNCSCPEGFRGHVCEKITTMSLSGKSTITINTAREEGYDIQFRFKTTLGDGLLALGKGLTFYILELSRGRLNLHSSLLNKWEGVFIGSNLNNSQWQKVFVAINSTHLVLSANDEQTIYPISFNENSNGTTYTSFPVTYIGGIPSNLKKLTHGQPFLVGCTEDVLINGEWILPEDSVPYVKYDQVDVSCKRQPQCNPNPCHSSGLCTDLWLDFRCTCGRPYLGHTCQYNYTAATFGYENITNSLVTVNVDPVARRAVRTIVDISMFVRTRQPKGQIFYLGSLPKSKNLADETYIGAQLEGGELLVRIQFNGTPEAYTVGGVKLDNGYDHLIEVIRNITLVQVKLNGTEYFRKTISATGTLDAQVLFLGGPPQSRPTRQANDNYINPDSIAPTASAVIAASSLSNVHFKGIIQDVQLSNGSSTMVVEFFPLNAEELEIPMSFGDVQFDNTTVLEGVRSDNSCSVNRCLHAGVCENTWNDYRCICTRGFKGKDCSDLEFCEIEKCPPSSVCKNLEDGSECVANATFDGKQQPFQYHRVVWLNSTKSVTYDTLELTYRSRSWGTLFFAKYEDDYFAIFIYYNEVVVQWRIGKTSEMRTRFRKDRFEGQWLTLFFEYKKSVFKGGFKDMVMDENPNMKATDFDIHGFIDILKNGVVYIGGSDGKSFDYQDVIESSDFNMTGYIPVSDTTTTMSITSNSLEIDDSSEFLLYKVDQNKTTDRFKGCVNEVRIGGLLLPFFTSDQLSLKNHYFELSPDVTPEIGCILCYASDCHHEGTCINPTDTYKCDCLKGYTADDCSIDINECENNRCENNATCEDRVGYYECRCEQGFEGKYCEEDIDECLSNPCRHGGTCNNGIGTFKCECREGYAGKQCEAPILITCDNKPCKEGATCVTGANANTGNNFTCHCTEGMEGPLCDTPFCLRQHCENGSCNTTDEVPYCQCIRGFEGVFCEINIDDCVAPTGESPCQNGGICHDGVNRFDCDCSDTGYRGLLCELDIDECETDKNACGSLGVCENLPGSYWCKCEDKHKCGHHCLLDNPCEVAKPCVEGTCVPSCTKTADYICQCNDNYTGKNCSDYKVAASHMDSVNVLYIVIPIVLLVSVGIAIGLAVLVNIARSKRATRGTYSPSAQEFCNPRVELDHVLKPPPEERLI